ncbi:MAG TPA: hypothetical protein VFN23_12610 [Ktedonobacteraceae bacterium]|nr:hypothetical protein [Ktedonobacteraceae bacterium]
MSSTIPCPRSIRAVTRMLRWSESSGRDLPRDGFMPALVELDKAVPSLRANDVWRVWRDEAQNGLAAAQNRLASLGAELLPLT